MTALSCFSRRRRGGFASVWRWRVAAGALVLPTFLLAISAKAAPPPPSPPPAIPATPAALGKTLFFDTDLSHPSRLACASCHAPEAGFSYPISNVNLLLGPVPGAVPGRFGNRIPPTISYAALLTPGPPHFDNNLFGFTGGLFWDGRAANLVAQASLPMENPNEMNNVLHNVAAPQLVVAKVAGGPNARLFQQVYGASISSMTTDQAFQFICQAIAAYETSSEVSPFTSKYDAYLLGLAKLNPSELNGLGLFTGSTTGRPGGPAFYKNVQCVLCHTIQASAATGPDLFTNSFYGNDGVPRNPNNPFYTETNSKANPLGYNPLGKAYVDLGLGDFIYPSLGLPSGNLGPNGDGQGDYLAVNGTFKAPTLRNVDKRPNASFVKAYMHNGYFKSLKDVVHFYNTRNLTTVAGEVIDFTKANPYAGLKGKPLFPQPEYASPTTLQNPTGLPPAAFGLVGNLGLTDQEENDIVAFLQTLSDGYFTRPK